jgi:superfamily II DNA or RNA helicase/very-short-patch-repair endonuclease
MIGGKRDDVVSTAHETLSSTTFLEYAFLRWVLSPAVRPEIYRFVTPQREVEVGGRRYLVDYEISGSEITLAVELDGYGPHGGRAAFSYDRMRQNDLHATGRVVARFSYDSIRTETMRCVHQLHVLLLSDPLLASFVVTSPEVESPQMDPDPVHALDPSLSGGDASMQDSRAPAGPSSYFDEVRGKLNQRTLRECQTQAFEALSDYYAKGGTLAACVMSVGAGKTALGVAASFAFARRRALVVTPGSVIRGVFDRAFDHTVSGNVLYGLPGGPLIPGSPPPKVLTLDREEGTIRGVSREDLLSADVIVTNFHSLGDGSDPDHLLSKLTPDDVDLIIVDEAHIAAAESYQRTFAHFSGARNLLMSACFRRLDGRPIEADVVYRYLLIDSVADGNAKNLRVTRFSPDVSKTTYEMVWPDGLREEFVGRDALLEVIEDERKLARITAKSDEPIRQLMREVKRALDEQSELLHPVKPRVLFSALGERHAEQVARIATEAGIPSAHLHHSMTESRIRGVRERFENDSGDLRGIVQLKMLGQGYDFPPITVVVPFRPYGSFAEFYQFVGRGIRVINHPALIGRVGPGEQSLDLIYHAVLGLDEHVETIYEENDMDPAPVREVAGTVDDLSTQPEVPGVRGIETAERPDTFVLFERGALERRIVHDAERVEERRREREREAFARSYADYAASTTDPIPFEQYVEIARRLSG